MSRLTLCVSLVLLLISPLVIGAEDDVYKVNPEEYFAEVKKQARALTETIEKQTGKRTRWLIDMTNGSVQIEVSDSYGFTKVNNDWIKNNVLPEEQSKIMEELAQLRNEGVKAKVQVTLRREEVKGFRAENRQPRWRLDLGTRQPPPPHIDSNKQSPLPPRFTPEGEAALTAVQAKTGIKGRILRTVKIGGKILVYVGIGTATYEVVVDVIEGKPVVESVIYRFAVMPLALPVQWWFDFTYALQQERAKKESQRQSETTIRECIHYKIIKLKRESDRELTDRERILLEANFRRECVLERLRQRPWSKKLFEEQRLVAPSLPQERNDRLEERELRFRL